MCGKDVTRGDLRCVWEREMLQRALELRHLNRVDAGCYLQVTAMKICEMAEKKCLRVGNRSFMSCTNWLSCCLTLFKMTSAVIYKSVQKWLSQSLQMVTISSSQPAAPVVFSVCSRNWLEIDFQRIPLGWADSRLLLSPTNKLISVTRFCQAHEFLFSRLHYKSYTHWKINKARRLFLNYGITDSSGITNYDLLNPINGKTEDNLGLSFVCAVMNGLDADWSNQTRTATALQLKRGYLSLL